MLPPGLIRRARRVQKGFGPNCVEQAPPPRSSMCLPFWTGWGVIIFHFFIISHVGLLTKKCTLGESARRLGPGREGPSLFIFFICSFCAFWTVPGGWARGRGLGLEASGRARGLDQSMQKHNGNKAFRAGPAVWATGPGPRRRPGAAGPFHYSCFPLFSFLHYF